MLLPGVLVTPQYPLFGVHRIALVMCRVFKGIGAGSVRLLSHSKEEERAGREKDDDTQRPTTDITKTRSLEIRKGK